MPEVKRQTGPASGNIDNNKNTVGLEKVVPPVPDQVPTTILRSAADGRCKARLVIPVRKQRHGTDRANVAAKDKFGRSQNGTLDHGVKNRQAVG